MRMRLPQENWGDAERNRWLRELATRLQFGSFAWAAMPAVGASATVDTTLAAATYTDLSGLRAGCAVKVTPPATLPAGLVVEAWCAAADSLTIRLTNVTGAPIAGVSATWAFQAVIA